VLFASLWQGACIAFAVAVVLAFAGRRLNAATRCILLQGTLVAVAIVPFVTTLPSVASQTLMRFEYAIAHAPAGKGVARRGGLMTVPRRIDVGLSDRAVALLIAAWLIGVVVLTLRVAADSLQPRAWFAGAARSACAEASPSTHRETSACRLRSGLPGP
jgi:hypothetical protein